MALFIVCLPKEYVKDYEMMDNNVQRTSEHSNRKYMYFCRAKSLTFQKCSINVTAGEGISEFPDDTNGFVSSRCTVSGLEGWLSGHIQQRNFTYAEINCKGRGSDISKRAPWEKKLDAQQIDQSTFKVIDPSLPRWMDSWLACQTLPLRLKMATQQPLRVFHASTKISEA
ncbi:hypothetical protein SADUNF_Sadunf11G0023400 [Salix dunnii]|uniref:Uncharacterized protein n=1 Tax=Salix dunnii TaxID=1413687 RepID=A0A835JSL8_9ROSI|nr:hypothetical protein SADUNF_Sadunf11G0023400 [Salix dunnii]